MGKEFLTTDAVLLVDTPTTIRETAFEKFKKSNTTVSYTDCVVMAFAGHYGTKIIFGFDEIFIKSGYVLPSQIAEQSAA